MLSPDELRLLEALRAGDEAAFTFLVGRYHASIMRLARIHLPDRGAAEEVVQDAWLGVLRGLGRFEGRSSLKTWIFRILVSRARTAFSPASCRPASRLRSRLSLPPSGR